MEITRELITLQEPYLHLALGTDSDFCDFAWKWFNGNSNAIARIIRGKKCKAIDGLFDEFAAVLQFPYYFGENWDAFDECINDLDWLSGSSYILFIANADHILSADENNFSIFIKIVLKTIAEWTKGRDHDGFPTSPMPFHIIFHCEDNKQNEFMIRLKKVEVNNLDVIKLPCN